MSNRIAGAVVLALLASGTTTVTAQVEAGSPTPAAEVPGGEPVTVRFTLSGMPYDQVLDVISRQTGLAVIRQTEVPEAAMTFISPERYTLDKAVEIINLAFKAHGVRLERDDGFLYLRAIADAARRPTRVVAADGVDAVEPAEYATVYITLRNALAATVAERLKPLVAEPGLVQALDGQNMLLIVETGEQCRRLVELVERIDAERPADVDFGLFPLRFTEAGTIVQTVRSLVPERDQMVTIDNNKQAQVYDDVSKPPLRVFADERLNAIVAVGPPARMGVVEELVAMLDVSADGSSEAGDASKRVRVYTLEGVTPEEAASRLAPLFAEDAQRARPVLQALPGAGKLVAQATAAQLGRLEVVLAELDPGVLDRDASAPTATRVIELEHVKAAEAESTLRRLLTARQARVLRIAPMPGGRGLVVAGPTPDVEAVGSLLSGLDLRPQADTEARRVAIRTGHPDRVLAEAMRVDQLTDEGREDPVRPALDLASRSVTLVGSKAAIDRFERVLREVQDALARQVQTRVIDVRAVDAAGIVGPILELLAASGANDGRVAPEITVIERSNTLVVTGDAETLQRVEELARRLDRVQERPASAWRAFELATADAAEVARAVEQAINDRARWPEDLTRAESSGRGPARPTAQADVKANRVVVSAPAPLLSIAEQVVAAMDGGPAPEPVEVRAFRLTEGTAASVAEALRTALNADVRPGEPRPTVSSEAGSNTVLVTGSASAMSRAEGLVAAMDERAEVEGLGVRTVVLKHARAEAVAPLVERVLQQQGVVDLVPDWLKWQMVWELERRGRDVETRAARVVADPRLNAVVVSAPLGLLDLAEQIVTSLDAQPEGGVVGLRPVRVVPLRAADAAAVELAVRAMFEGDDASEAPPTVRADRSSNALIVRGSPEQVEAVEVLAGRLDAAAGSASTRLRTIPIDPSRMGANEAARQIQRMMEQRGGVRVEVITAEELLRPPSNGQPRVEPTSPDEAAASPGQPQSNAGWIAPRPWLIGPLVGVQPVAAVQGEHAAADPVPVVRIVVDPATNSLVVEGAERVSEQIARLAEELQRQTPAEPTAVRIVQLPASADPNTLASFIQQTVQHLGRTGPQNPGGFTGRVAVTPDRASGSLIVWANETDFATVRDLIAGLSRVDRSVSLTVKIYPLDNASADRARATLQTLLRPNVGTGRTGEVEIELPGRGDAGPVRASIDPAMVTVTSDPSLTALIVTAPESAFGLIDAMIEQVDDAPAAERLAIRRYELQNAQAGPLSRTLQSVFDAQRQGPVSWEQPRARFVADERSNALLVTATRAQHAEVGELLAAADESLEEAGTVLEIIPVRQGRPSAIAGVIREVFVGRDPARAESLRISPQDESGVLVVRAAEADAAEVRSLVERLDQPQGATHPVRSIKLANGDAEAIARSLQQFFRDRARIQQQRGIRAGGGDAAIVGDRRSGTIVVAASDEDYEQVASLVAQFDSPAEGREFQYKIIPLEHIRVTDIERTVQSITWELQWERMPWGGQPDQSADKVYAYTNERTNSVVLFGQGDTFEVIERIIAEMDRPGSDMGKTIVRAVRAPGVDLGAVERMVEQMTATPGWRVWQGRDPEAVQVEVDRRRNVLILIGKQPTVEAAVEHIEQIVAGGLGEGEIVEIVALRSARARELAGALGGALPEGVAVRVTPVDRTNSILLTGAAADVERVKAQIAQLDREPERPPVEFRRFALEHADAFDLASVLRQMVRNRPRAQGEPAPGIDTLLNENTLAVTASGSEMAFIAEMVSQFDVPREVARRTEFIKLQFADAEQTSEALRVFYGRYAPQATTNAQRSVSIVPDPASNSLVISADDNSWQGITELLSKLDTPEYDISQQLVVIPLRHASAAGVARALNEGFRQPLQDRLDRERVRFEADRRGRGDRDRDFFEPTVLIESEGVPVVSAEPQSNSLIVFAGRKELDRIRQIVSQLDVADYLEMPQARILPVRSGTAASIAQAATRVFAADLDERNPRRVLIVGDEASATIVVRADEERFMEIAGFVAAMERRAEAGQPRAQLYPLAVLPAARVRDAVVRTLRPLAQSRGETLSIEVEPTSNSLLVAASEGMHAEVRRLVEALESPLPQEEDPLGGAGPVEQEVRIVPLRVASAQSVVDQLRAMLQSASTETAAGPAAALAEQVRRLRLDHGGAPIELDLTQPVRLTADNAGNAVIVASTPANTVALEAIIGLLDRLPLGEAVMVKIFPLENASAERLRTIVETLFREGERVRRVAGTQRSGQSPTAVGQALSGQVSATVDERTNSLIVAGPEASLALVEVLIADLDSDRAERGWLETAIIPLEHADAVSLAEKLRSVLVQGLGQTPEAVGLRRQIGRLRVGGVQGGGVEADLYAPLSGVVITADEDLNALLTVATPTNLRAIRGLVAQLDVPQAAAGNAVRVVPLVHADAQRVGEIVEDVFNERAQQRSFRPEDRVVVSVDTRLNTLVISTSPRSWSLLEGLLSTLDQPESRFAVGLHIIPVPGADAAALAPRIQRLMQERLRAAQPAGRRSASDAFSVEADPAAGVLIVASSSENADLVRELVASLTTGGLAVAEPTETTALVQLVSPGRAAEVAQAARTLYVEPQLERRGPRALAVVANERLNALLVTGTQADVDAIEAIARRLDEAQTGLVEEVRRIPLNSASARETVALIEDVLAGRSITGGAAGTRATRVRVWSDRLEDFRSDALIDGDIRSQVNLTPDPRTNSVLVKAPPELMNLIVTMLSDLDMETRGDRVIETFRLVNADAVQMASLLAELFNLQQNGDRFVLAPARENAADDQDAPGAARPFTTIPDERQQLAVTVDRRTNTLLVSGTGELIDEVRRVVASLDEVEATDRERLVYHLRNARAAEIALTLQSYFQGESDLRRTTLGPQLSGSLLRELEQEVTVIGDPNSNKLVVSASPRYMDAVRLIIEELDSAPPQVMIQVLIAEVTLDSREEFGIDIALGGTVATTTPGGLASQSAGSNIGGDGFVFDALAAGGGVATALGVPNLAVASSDFGLLIRALQSQGKLEVLSRPQVQVNDNESALINVGEDIAITTGVERRDNTTTAIVERRPVGITLDVTPSISADGYVRLDIAPEISTLSPRTTQIEEGFEAPIITQRRVETTVTVRDGETVVIGGLIQTSDSEISTKVPLLGDLPLLGGLFRTNEKGKIKTELLVILTPYVIPGDRASSQRIQRAVSERALNSLEDRSGVDRMLMLGNDPADAPNPAMEPLYEGPIDKE